MQKKKEKKYLKELSKKMSKTNKLKGENRKRKRETKHKPF